MNQIEKNSINRWLVELSKVQSKDRNAKLWHYVYALAVKPRRKRISINLSKLERYANAGENIVVPGKVLGSGTINKNISIAAIEYSKDASDKLKKAKCSMLAISEMVKKESIRIII